jgi:hypothetical protein
MKAKVSLLVCGLLVSVAAVLSAQNVTLDAEFEKRVAALDAKDAQKLFDLAVEMFEKGQHPEARAAADRMLVIDASDTRALYLVKATNFYAEGGPKIVGKKIDDDDGAGRVRANVINLSAEEVDAVYKTFGNQRMADFRAIQNSILLRRCATKECHGNTATSGAFYIKTKDLANRKTIAENLEAVRGYVNELNPGGSRILSITIAPTEEHPAGPVLRNERDRFYQRLKRFVENMPGQFGG